MRDSIIRVWAVPVQFDQPQVGVAHGHVGQEVPLVLVGAIDQLEALQPPRFQASQDGETLGRRQDGRNPGMRFCRTVDVEVVSRPVPEGEMDEVWSVDGEDRVVWIGVGDFQGPELGTFEPWH